MATYLQIYNSWTSVDSSIRSRAVIAVATYSRYVRGVAAGTPNAISAGRLAWATAAATRQGALDAASALTWDIAGDPAYLQDGENISDAALQGAVETAVNNVTAGV